MGFNVQRIICVGAIAGALALGGCVTSSTPNVLLGGVVNPVTPTSLYDVKATYAIAQAGANAYIQRYRDGHRCTKTALESVTNLCSRRSIVVKMQNADRAAQIALGKADTFILNNPTIDATSVISAASLAVSALYSIQQGNP